MPAPPRPATIVSTWHFSYLSLSLMPRVTSRCLKLFRAPAPPDKTFWQATSEVCCAHAARPCAIPTTAAHGGLTRNEIHLRRCPTTGCAAHARCVFRAPTSTLPAPMDRSEQPGSIHPQRSRPLPAIDAAPARRADATIGPPLPHQPATATSYRAPPGAPTHARE